MGPPGSDHCCHRNQHSCLVECCLRFVVEEGAVMLQKLGKQGVAGLYENQVTVRQL